jgi:pyruvate ferredoxin oxidoreductase gamma subunit
MAGEVLAEAFFEAGKWVQAFSSYGGARRGTPVLTAIRVDDKPVRLRSNIEHPDAIVCFDPSLLGPALLEGAQANTVVLVNSSKAPEEFSEYGDFRWATIDGISIAVKNGLGRIVNSAVLGAFARVMGAPEMESLARTVEEVSPVKKPQNAQAARDGYEQVKTAWEQAA